MDGAPAHLFHVAAVKQTDLEPGSTRANLAASQALGPGRSPFIRIVGSRQKRADSMATNFVARVRRSLITLPSGRSWIECAAAGLVLAICLGPLGFGTGLLHLSPRSPSALAQIAIIAFFVPAFFEELVFRAALIPDRTEQKAAIAHILGSTLLFTAWHLVEARIFPDAAPTFVRADFLVSAAVLGLACAVLRRRSGTIWTAVVLHWLVVVVWLGWLGGPSLSELGGFQAASVQS